MTKVKINITELKKAVKHTVNEARVVPPTSKKQLIDKIYEFNPYMLKNMIGGEDWNIFEYPEGIDDFLEYDMRYDPETNSKEFNTAKDLLLTFLRIIKPEDIKIVYGKTSVAGYAYVEEKCPDEEPSEYFPCYIILTKF